jgi:hypothetical protein
MDLSENVHSDNLALGAVAGVPQLDALASGIKSLFKKKKSAKYQADYTAPPGYVPVAEEGQSITFAAPADVALGCNGQFVYLTGKTGKVDFTVPFFGGLDPVMNKVKMGYARLQSQIAASAATTDVTTETTMSKVKKFLPYIIGAVLLGIVIYFILKRKK